MNDKIYKIIYEFRFEDGKRKVFNIRINPETMNIIKKERKNNPKWTRLEFNQCECCPLTVDAFTYCPIAVNISELVDEFKNVFSYKNCIVRCTAPERTYFKKTTITQGLFSILGVINATSECPIMSFFKPMARFHLPFSTVEETLVRATSIYLLRQYFDYQKGLMPDLDLKKFEAFYIKVKYVNEGILRRIKTVGTKDANKNAIILFHSLAQVFSMDINYRLDTIRFLFDSWQ